MKSLMKIVNDFKLFSGDPEFEFAGQDANGRVCTYTHEPKLVGGYFFAIHGMSSDHGFFYKTTEAGKALVSKNELGGEQ